MSLDTLHTDIRRDANPTPTRFLLECGVFTPGFEQILESYNPFDASYKFLNTGTPKAESNPFDTSFRIPSSTVSVPNSVRQSQSLGNESQKQQYQQSDASGQQQQHAFDRHPWADMMFDEVPMPMSHMSPGLSSASTTSSPPSPPLDSPPTVPSSFRQFPSVASEVQENAHTYDHGPMFPFDCSRNFEQISQNGFATIHSPQIRTFATINPIQAFSEQADRIQSGPSLRSDEIHHDEGESEVEQPFDYNTHSEKHMGKYPEDSEMATEISLLRVQQNHESSVMSSVSAGPTDGSQNSSAEAIMKEIKGRNAKSKSTKVSKTKKTTDISSKKAKTSSKPSSRKRPSQEQENPEVKRQKFLERNRMAASKCREKKRLQTMKIITDADEITCRNQQLLESLGELQEEVRFLKNQILAHRNCECDVIQKFLQTSYDSPSSPSSKSMMQF